MVMFAPCRAVIPIAQGIGKLEMFALYSASLPIAEGIDKEKCFLNVKVHYLWPHGLSGLQKNMYGIM